MGWGALRSLVFLVLLVSNPLERPSTPPTIAQSDRQLATRPATTPQNTSFQPRARCVWSHRGSPVVHDHNFQPYKHHNQLGISTQPADKGISSGQSLIHTQGCSKLRGPSRRLAPRLHNNIRSTTSHIGQTRRTQIDAHPEHPRVSPSNDQV